MTSQRFVVVVGDLVTDIVAQVSRPIAVGSDTPARINVGGGGSGANVAAWLADAGVGVALVSRVGADEDGRNRVAELADSGVATHVALDADAPTGRVVVLVTPGGERTMLPDRGANARLSAEDVRPDLFSPGRHLHLSGYTLFSDATRPAALHALRLAAEARMTISVDPSSAQPLRDVGPQAFLEWTAGADVCLPNVAEALVLTGTTDAAQALRALAGSYAETVITLGGDGAVWSDGRAVAHAPAADGTVEDTIGAGDAFTAGYLMAYLAGAAPQQRLEHAVALAGRAVATRGARPRRPN